MASVQSVTIYDDFPNGSSQRERRYKVTIATNSGALEEYILSPVVVDVLDDGSTFGAAKFASLADDEAVIGRDVAAEYQSQPDYDRRALGKAMLKRDIDDFHAVLPLYLAMTGRGGANAGQRASYLNVLTVDYNLMAARFNDDQGAAGFIDDAKNQVWEDLPPEWN